MTLMEELQLQNDTLAEIDRDYSALKAELEVKREGLEEKLKKAGINLDSLNQKRAQVSKAIPQPVFMRYEFIRVRLDHCGCDGRHLLRLQYRGAPAVLH